MAPCQPQLEAEEEEEAEAEAESRSRGWSVELDQQQAAAPLHHSHSTPQQQHLINQESISVQHQQKQRAALSPPLILPELIKRREQISHQQ